MNTVPTRQTLAALLSSVTETMFSLRFEPTETPAQASTSWRTAVLLVGQDPAYLVMLSADEAGCRTLGAAMFGCTDDKLDPIMVDDSLRELLNMTAGLIKREMSLDHALGLPRIIDGLTENAPDADELRGVVLRATNSNVFVSISRVIT